MPDVATPRTRDITISGGAWAAGIQDTDPTSPTFGVNNFVLGVSVPGGTDRMV